LDIWYYTFRKGHMKKMSGYAGQRGTGVDQGKSGDVGQDQLKAFKGTRAGAERDGEPGECLGMMKHDMSMGRRSNKVAGYAGAPMAGKGHPGAHES
jgi:hypothetical protein